MIIVSFNMRIFNILKEFLINQWAIWKCSIINSAPVQFETEIFENIWINYWNFLWRKRTIFMIYFFFFFFFENSLHWSEFNSEKKLQTACYFCQRIMNQINSNSSTSFLPAFNSTCSLSNQMNHYCSLFRELPDLLKVLRQTESQLIPNNSC